MMVIFSVLDPTNSPPAARIQSLKLPGPPSARSRGRSGVVPQVWHRPQILRGRANVGMHRY